jgi:PKD repeat protein
MGKCAERRKVGEVIQKRETVNSIPSVQPGYFIDFDVTPHGDIVTFQTMYAKYVYNETKVGHPDNPDRIAMPAMYNHDVGRELTFTARIVEPMLQLEVEEWYWDFGDGVFASGNPVTHTYHYPNPGTLAHVQARTTDGVISYATMNLMLYPSGPPPPPKPVAEFTWVEVE